jgi:glyoxylase-like metal-dependent hydrolase (beta-lactamase superfamily II)
MNWSRDQAIRYMVDNAGVNEAYATAEVDRYIVWPGQALGYKVGELRIKALRAKAKAALGDKFDVRSFHNAVLDDGALPLTVLEARIDEFIARESEDDQETGDAMKIRSLIAAAALAALPAAAQQDFSKVEIKTTKLGDTTYLMEGAGGNLGLSIGEDAVFLIDDQFAPLSEKIQAAIAKLTSKPVKFILNTHWHFDHTGGNENFGRAGAIVVAHENVRKRMSSEQFIEFLKMTEKPSPRGALPIVTFAGSVTFHLNGDEMRALHVPRAHTDGDAIVHFVKTDVIHMGDIYFNGMYPFIDTSSGGSIEGVISGATGARHRRRLDEDHPGPWAPFRTRRS